MELLLPSTTGNCYNQTNNERSFKTTETTFPSPITIHAPSSSVHGAIFEVEICTNSNRDAKQPLKAVKDSRIA